MAPQTKAIIANDVEKGNEIDMVLTGLYHTAFPANRNESYTPLNRAIEELGWNLPFALFLLEPFGILTEHEEDLTSLGVFQFAEYDEVDPITGNKTRLFIHLISETGIKFLHEILKIVSRN